jgi:hypothetical protein
MNLFFLTDSVRVAAVLSYVAQGFLLGGLRNIITNTPFLKGESALSLLTMAQISCAPQTRIPIRRFNCALALL